MSGRHCTHLADQLRSKAQHGNAAHKQLILLQEAELARDAQRALLCRQIQQKTLFETSTSQRTDPFEFGLHPVPIACNTIPALWLASTMEHCINYHWE